MLIMAHTVVQREIYNLVWRLFDYADLRGRAVGMQPLDCWDRGSNPTDGLAVRLLCLLCVV